MAPGNRVFAMDVTKTLPPMIEIRSGPDWYNPRPERPAKRFAIAEPIKTWKPVFIRDEIDDHDLFCDGELDGYIFVSDRLRQDLVPAALTGFDFLGPYHIGSADV